MATATLIGEALPQYAPTTNLYRCSDGKYLLVTIQSWDVAGTLETIFGISVPILKAQLPSGADVFLADEAGFVVDADGEPENGMTPLAVVPQCTSFTDALQQVGYELGHTD